MTSPEGSIAKRAIALIEQQGSARSSWLAGQLGVPPKEVSSSLNPYCKNGTLVACKVQRPGAQDENEYRMSKLGRGMSFAIRGDVTRSPAVRDGRLARPTMQHPSGLHLEAANGRPKAPDDRRTTLLAAAWPGVDAPRPPEQTDDVADDANAPEAEAAEVRTTSRPGGSTEVRALGTRASHVAAQVEAPSSRPAMPLQASTTFRCALANDGSLLLMRKGVAPIDLCPSETRALVDYLRKLDELSLPRFGEAELPESLRAQAK